jgi:type VI secretion system secreted protein Hcp
MAETVHLFLKVNGSDIKGESSQRSLGRADSIECVYFEEQVRTGKEAGSGHATGRRQHEDVLIRKRIDKSSPLLCKALVKNERVTEAKFQFFRPSPMGDGTTQQFYTITLEGGHITGYRILSPDVTIPNATALPPLEEIRFSFDRIKWNYTDGGVEHEDTWSDNA